MHQAALAVEVEVVEVRASLGQHLDQVVQRSALTKRPTHERSFSGV
jgi:hypothetical protein